MFLIFFLLTLQRFFLIRFLSPDSDVPYFKLGSQPAGKFVSTSATLVDSELDCFKAIVDVLHVSIYIFHNIEKVMLHCV